ncbi:MAG: SpoIIE family protein phosphatase [Phycisphaerae bacterium]|nr:SpoIIE family protein phosphatase [Phycisphaerae bacterium]MCZ2401203.1 SpoIIE family protein phosphatase [Phycisphaerae bacterium]NUQ48767.1 SpoIIE family protein phosphatase [Phycisphaerae bacterium]
MPEIRADERRATSMPKLIIHTPEGQRCELDLAARHLKLGRADWCDFVLRNDAEVSREHAEIWLDDGGSVIVEDLGSKNGTRVDDGPVFKGARRPAARMIRIGEHEIEIVGASRSAEQPRFAPDHDTRLSDTQYFPSSRGLGDFNQQRLGLLIQLTERIGGVFERKQLLEQALDACCEALGFERGLIVLKTQRGDTELPVVRNIQRDETGAFKVSRTIINRALVEGERAIVNNPATDLQGSLTESLVRFPICSALCVPILYRGDVLGVVYGDRITQASTYQPEDVDFLAAIAQQVGVGLANLALFQEREKAQLVYAELKQARAIQQRLLPAAPLSLGLVRVEGYNEPSSAVSGDYYDFFDLEDGRVGLIIADVTGHGLPAALLMANLQSAVRVALSSEVPLPELAERLNKLICRNTASHVFITAILGTVDTRTGVVEYVSAGHPGPLLIERGRVQEPLADRNSLPLGIEPDETYQTSRIEPARERRALMFYTDGVVEAADRDGAMLGVRPVINALAMLHTHTAEEVIRTVRQTVRKHLDGVSSADDMTLLAVQLTGGD